MLHHGIDQRRPLHAPHTLSNLPHCSYHDLQKNTPSSTVAHYAHQQPATSVSWHRLSGGGSGNSGNLVAMGSLGSGNYGTFASNITVGEDIVASREAGLSTRQTFWGAAQSGGVAGVSSSLTSLHLSQTTRSPAVTTGGAVVVIQILVSSSLTSLHLSQMTRSPAVTTGGGSGGDPDFITLVWDIEAQSSMVSGAGTIVGGHGKKATSSVNMGSVHKGGKASVVPI